MPNASEFETWRTSRDGLRWIAPLSRSTGTFETWLTLRIAPADLAATSAALSATGLRSAERLGLAVVTVAQSLVAKGIPTAERIGAGSFSLAAAPGSNAHHFASDWARMQHAISDGG